MHASMVSELVGILERKGFGLRGGVFNGDKHRWGPSTDATVVANNREALNRLLQRDKYTPSAYKGEKLRIDIIGGLYTDRRFDSGKSIAIEVSISSDIKTEVRKLRKVPSKWKVIVTEDTDGELDGIRVVSLQKFESFLEELTGTSVGRSRQIGVGQ